MRAYWISLSILFILMFGSCNPLPSEGEGAPDSTPSESLISTPLPKSSTQESETQTDPSLPIPAVSGIQRLIEKAEEDLAQRLSIATSQIQLIESREVFWSDASLGCPQPGTAYAQTVTPGYLIRLEANGYEFEYHANIHGHVFYCENPIPPVSETPTNVHP